MPPYLLVPDYLPEPAGAAPTGCACAQTLPRTKTTEAHAAHSTNLITRTCRLEFSDSNIYFHAKTLSNQLSLLKHARNTVKLNSFSQTLLVHAKTIANTFQTAFFHAKDTFELLSFDRTSLFHAKNNVKNRLTISPGTPGKPCLPGSPGGPMRPGGPRSPAGPGLPSGPCKYWKYRFHPCTCIMSSFS